MKVCVWVCYHQHPYPTGRVQATDIIPQGRTMNISFFLKKKKLVKNIKCSKSVFEKTDF